MEQLIKHNEYLSDKIEKLEKRNEYLSAKLNIHTNTHNKGEKDEVLLLIETFYLNDTKQYDKLVVSYGDEAAEGVAILCMDTGDVITDINKLSKAKGCCKADCIIKMCKTNSIYNISIKSKNCAPPSILNHTPRTAKVFKPDGKLYEYVKSLDIIAKEYIDKREEKTIGEDVSIDKLESLANPSVKSDLLDVLVYFMFEGSGKGDSICKANSILYYENGNIIFTKCRSIEEKREYIQSIYNKVIISWRNKGMPTIDNDYCNPWVFKDKSSGIVKDKGSLHIRLNR